MQNGHLEENESRMEPRIYILLVFELDYTNAKSLRVKHS